MYELHERGQGTKLVLISSTGKQIIFAEPGQAMPKLHKVSREKWISTGKPEVIYI